MSAVFTNAFDSGNPQRLDFPERELLDGRKNPRHSNLISSLEPTQDLHDFFPYPELPLSDGDVQNFQEVSAILPDREIFEADGKLPLRAARSFRPHTLEVGYCVHYVLFELEGASYSFLRNEYHCAELVY